MPDTTYGSDQIDPHAATTTTTVLPSSSTTMTSTSTKDNNANKIPMLNETMTHMKISTATATATTAKDTIGNHSQASSNNNPNNNSHNHPNNNHHHHRTHHHQYQHHHYHHRRHNHHHQPSPPHPDTPPQTKEDLWRDPLILTAGESIIHITGMGSENHTVFARVAEGPPLSVGTVVESIVDAVWNMVVKQILEQRKHVEPDTYPSAKKLFELGAVWIMNETTYLQSHDAQARRLCWCVEQQERKDEEEGLIPNWTDETLRVHYLPDRFYAALQYDWTKYCRGLLVGNTVKVRLGDETPHVSFHCLPDTKDGVIVYEDDALGFAILNKPGEVPIHATISNHAEDVLTMYRNALAIRKIPNHRHIAILHRFALTLDTETYGLLPISYRNEFSTYLSNIAERTSPDDPARLRKTFKCLVCVKHPNDMDILEQHQKTGTIVTHYYDMDTHRFYRSKPKGTSEPSGNGSDDPNKANNKQNDFAANHTDNHKNHKKNNHIHTCQLRIVKVGDDKFRAACVRSVYPQSVDSCLAHRLWGPTSQHPAEDLGISYVMELEVELITAYKHQVRGQLAAMGFPIVGDYIHGGGHCDVHYERHGWNRMALQCCELSFMEPVWKETGHGGKKELIPSENHDRRYTFRLQDAWWTNHLVQYERYHENISLRYN